jgi:hypothetical protein
VVKLEKDRVVFLSDKKFFAIKPEGSLQEALAKPLGPGELKALELRDRDLVLAETRVEKLEFKKDRKGFEAVLVNPERKDDGNNKDGKIVVAVDPLPEEFDAPEVWIVKDRFGTDLLAIKALKVDSNRLVFAAEKKVYAIGAGESLRQALARPLSEKEIKDLGVKAP